MRTGKKADFITYFVFLVFIIHYFGMIFWTGRELDRKRSLRKNSKSDSKSSSNSIEKQVQDSIIESKKVDKTNKFSGVNFHDTSSPTIYSSKTSNKLSKKDREQLYQCFAKYDLNSNGVLDLKQLQNMVRDGGYALSRKTVCSMFKDIKQLKGKGISFDDLTEMLEIQDGASDTEQDLNRIFRMYDPNERGGFSY